MEFLVLAGDIRRNFGDTAIALGVLALIREADPAASVRIAGPPALLPGGFEGVEFVPGDPAILAAARRTDLVVWGGGQLLAGNRSRAKVPLWAARIEAMHRLGARIVGIGQGVGPLPARSDLRWTAHAVSRTAGFTVRDDESARLLRAAGVPEHRFRVTADPAVMLAPADGTVVRPAAAASGRPAIGLSPRWTAHHTARRIVPFRFLPPAARRRVFASTAYREFETALVALADRLGDELDVDLRLFPTYRAAWESDEPLSGAVAERVRRPERVRVIRPVRGVDELLAELRGVDLLLGMPMHATILATTQHVPTLAIPYEPKGTEYFRALGLPGLIGPPFAGAADVDAVMRRVTETWPERERVRAVLAERIAALRERARGSVAVLREALAAPRRGRRTA